MDVSLQMLFSTMVGPLLAKKRREVHFSLWNDLKEPNLDRFLDADPGPR
jgi:hypothetical protein